MTDQFDIQRDIDEAGEKMADDAMGLLQESKEKALERFGRLIQLDETHYFDPVDKWVLLKVGKNFRNLGHSPMFMELAAEKVEEQARAEGFAPVKGGFFWNAKTKHLYVKQGDRYVLYSLDRRNKPRQQ